jgi:hypothetical protein
MNLNAWFGPKFEEPNRTQSPVRSSQKMLRTGLNRTLSHHQKVSTLIMTYQRLYTSQYESPPEWDVSTCHYILLDFLIMFYHTVSICHSGESDNP